MICANLPLGGVQAKLTAAKSLNINTVLIPYGNKTDFEELPAQLKKGLTVYFVKTYNEVYSICFDSDSSAIESINKFDGTEDYLEESPKEKQNDQQSESLTTKGKDSLSV